MKKIFYSQEDMNSDLLEIIRCVSLEDWKPTKILAIGRGGYIPGVFLSHWYDLPLHTYHFSMRDLERTDKFNADLIQHLSKQNVLVIDDICDVGNTFGSLKKVMEQIEASEKYACLLYNIGEPHFEPDFWGKEINKVEEPCWVEYFWESWWKHNN